MLRFLSVGLFLALVGCGTARYTQVTPYGGTIELSGERDKAQEQAGQLMTQKCGPNNFVVLQEGEEPVGTDTYMQKNTAAAAQYNGDSATAQQQTTGVQSTRTATVWRIHFQCNNAGAPPPPPAPPGPAGGPPPPPTGDNPPPQPPQQQY